MIIDFTLRFFHRLATPTFFVFLLLVGAIGSVSKGLSEIITGLDFLPLFILALIALSLGWLLARTRFPGWLAAIFVFIIGLVGTYSWVGKLLFPLGSFIRVLVRWTWGYIQNQQDIIENVAPLLLASSELSIAFNSVWIDIQYWNRALLSGKAVSHISALFMIWGLLLWITSAWAGWAQRRRANVFLSLIPSTLILVALMGYTWANISSLLPLLFFVMLLLALTWLNKNEKHWQAAGVDYPIDARIDTLVAVVAISIILVAGAFFIPRISIRKMVESIRELTNPQVQQAQPYLESFGIESSKPSIGRFGSMLSGGLPRAHLIGAGPELSEQLIMTAQITAGLPPGEESYDLIPLYWRGLTYDRYTGLGWESSDVSLRKYSSDEPLSDIDRPGYWVIEQEIHLTGKSELLFAAGDLITTDQDFQIAWRSEPWITDIEQSPGDFFGAAADQQTYQAAAFIPVVDENTLRESSFLYPDWIRKNYTLVPISTTQRVVQLTLDLVEDVSNPYDRAQIIEEYLREFEYTTDLPEPPQDRDIADYFLFDLQKGYCDYFATTMVVMARAAYLPARLVLGYSRGTYDAANDRYIITEADAHSWPEVYFDNIGWVPFEPTSARDEITRSAEPVIFPQDSDYRIEPESFSRGLKPLFGSWLLTFGLLLISLVWGSMLWVTMDEWLLKRKTPQGMATSLFVRLYRRGSQLGVPAKKDDTPFEFSEGLQRQVVTLPIKSFAEKPMHQVNQAIAELTHIYIQAQYSPNTLTDNEKIHTFAIWQRIRRQLVLARFLYWIRKLKRVQSNDPESIILE